MNRQASNGTTTREWLGARATGIPSQERTSGRARGGTLALALGLGLTLAPACRPHDEEAQAQRDAERRAEIQQALTEYLPQLGQAYSSGDVELLRPWAVERVMAQVHKRIGDLQEQGLVLQATFHELTVEEMVTWSQDFALVTAMEIWDLRYESLGTGVLVSDRPGVRSRVQYQLRKEGDRWRVFHRDLVQEFDADS